jgi:N-acetyl-alpha-D-muramate 1-phosphate uridylyltransferase
MKHLLFPVLILAGGLATRLHPVTETIPKSLLEIHGEPFVAHQLRLLQQAGVREVILCVGYLGEMIEAFVGDGSRFGMQVRYSHDGTALLGTGGAIKKACPLAGENFFVLYGDSYLTCNYAAVQSAFVKSGKPALMTVFCNENQWDRANIEFSAGEIFCYDKKNQTENMRHIDYGLGVFSAKVFDTAAEGPLDLEVVYQSLLMRKALAAFEIFERFYEAGSFDGIRTLAAYLAKMEAAPDAKNIKLNEVKCV